MFELPVRYASRKAGRMSSAFQSRFELKRNADEFRAAERIRRSLGGSGVLPPHENHYSSQRSYGGSTTRPDVHSRTILQWQ